MICRARGSIVRVVVAILLGATALAGCGSSGPRSGLSTASITVDGTQRHYLIVRPPQTQGPRPLIVFLHGAKASGRQPLTELRIEDAARAAGVVVVYPDGVPPNYSWRSGCCQDWANSHADLDFIIAIVHQLVSDKEVDPRHVVIGGYSAGAITANALACDYPTTFRAVVAVAGTMLSPPPFVPAAAPSAKCAPARPISAYQIHGTADTTEPLGGSSSGCAVGGPCGPGAPQWQPSAGTVDSWWRTLDHCSEPTTASNARGTTSLATCADSTQVGLALVNGVGHDLAKLAAAFPIGRTLIELSLGRPPEW